MPADANMDIPGEAEDWTIEDRPGIRLNVAEGEYAIAQALANGFAMTWTSDDPAWKAVVDAFEEGRTEPRATIRYGRNDRAVLWGNDILPFLAENDSSWWVKLMYPDAEDYVVYVGGDADYPNELAVLGPPRSQTDQGNSERRDIKDLMKRTATEHIVDNLDPIFSKLLETITDESVAAG